MNYSIKFMKFIENKNNKWFSKDQKINDYQYLIKDTKKYFLNSNVSLKIKRVYSFFRCQNSLCYILMIFLHFTVFFQHFEKIAFIFAKFFILNFFCQCLIV